MMYYVAVQIPLRDYL